MSRIGKKVITIPEKTTVTYTDGLLTVTGPLGSLSRVFKKDINIAIDGNSVKLSPVLGKADLSAIWGTYASHVSNMVNGVNKAYVKKLIIEGIGYKCEIKGNVLVFSLGFSHTIPVEIPKGLTVTSEKNVLTISGIDKETVGQFSADLRAMKKPEPYKGKGIRYENEIVKRKQGKKTV